MDSLSSLRMSGEGSSVGTALIVSTDASLLHVLNVALRNIAISPQPCTGPEACSTLVSCRRYEVAFIDLNLGEYAQRAISAIRSGPSTRTAVLIAITHDNEQSNEAFRRGVHFVLEQPISRASVDGLLRAAYGLIIRERRRYFRCPVDVPVVARRRGEAAWIGRAANVSETGICIHAPVPLVPTDSVQLELKLPSSATEIKVEADVQWSDGKGRVGLRFTRMLGDSQSDLQRWLSDELDKYLTPPVTAVEGVAHLNVTAAQSEETQSPYHKKIYQVAELNRYGRLDVLPDKLRDAAEEILHERPVLRVTLDTNQRSTYVSEEFARLLGYNSRELVGRSIEEITTKGAVDLEFVFRALRRLHEAKGVWVFDSRSGSKLLCSYRATQSNDSMVAEFTPMFIAS